MSSTAIRNRARGLAAFSRVGSFALLVLLLLVVFRSVIRPFVLALVIAYVIAPVVRRLGRLRLGRLQMRRWMAVLLVYVVVLFGITLFFTYFLPRLASDLTRLVREAPKFFERVNAEYVPRLSSWVDRTFPPPLEPETTAPPARPEHGPPAPDVITGAAPPPGTTSEDVPQGTQALITDLGDGRYAVSLEGLRLHVNEKAQGRLEVSARGETASPSRQPLGEWVKDLVETSETEVASLLRLGQKLVTSILSLFTAFIVTLMVAGFLLVDLERFHAFLRSLLPEASRHHYDRLVGRIDQGLSGVIRGQLLICMVNGILTYVGLVIFQVKYPILLGLVAGVMSLIPIFGSIMSSIPIIVVAMVSDESGVSLVRGLLMLGWILGIHALEANVLNPKIIGTTARIHPVIVIFALVAGEHAYGIVGALLAAPTASVLQTLLLYAWRLRDDPATAAAPSTPAGPSSPPPAPSLGKATTGSAASAAEATPSPSQ